MWSGRDGQGPLNLGPHLRLLFNRPLGSQPFDRAGRSALSERPGRGTTHQRFGIDEALGQRLLAFRGRMIAQIDSRVA